ncbi:MAG TPA: helix-turn-helix domain-containing protein [Thermoanaerobaculia bacterium]|nr:helix-turn-helix domain-containing protein [Thermoanaerobaculia bacterium]
MPDQEPEGQGGGSELASFGEELRREREIRGISLKEIADATKISKRFLEAIERNDHRTLPAPVFTRGFVREYARYVGLNAEEMVNRYNFAAARDDRIEKPPDVQKYPQTPVRDITPKPPPKRGIPPAYARVNRNLFALVIIVAALVAVAWWAVQHKRLDLDATADTSTAIPLTTRAAAPVTTPAPAPTQPDDSTLRLAVKANANSWVELEADGERVFRDEMTTGTAKTFDARESFRFVTIGNAPALTLTLNGTPVPAYTDDVIKNRVFDREALQRLRNEAVAPQATQP